MILSEEAIMYYADHPVEFVEDILCARPDKKQKAILQSVADNPATTVRSGHGIGKSAVLSWLVIWFNCTRPFPKIPCTAPTQHQLFDILWAEISKWLRNNPQLERELIWTQHKVFMKDYPEEWFAVARTSSKPDALQGFHADHILYIIDEASGVDDKIFEPILGSLSTKGSKIVMCGNPTRLVGFFYDSHHKYRTIFNSIHIDGRNSERVDPEFIETIKEMFGEDSDVFRVRVAGEFPRAMPDSFIPLDWCERACEKTENKELEEPTRIDLGIDVARYGDDNSVIMPVIDRVREEQPSIYPQNNTTELAGYAIIVIKQYARIYKYANIYVKIDCDGLGVGVYDMLVEQKEQIIVDIMKEREGKEYEQSLPEFKLEFVECHFGGAGGKINENDPVEYSNSTGIMWGSIREELRNNRLKLIRDDRLISQLSNRKFIVNSKGAIELERKEAMKKRGLTSPDLADALGLALYNPVLSDWTLD